MGFSNSQARQSRCMGSAFFETSPQLALRGGLLQFSMMVPSSSESHLNTLIEITGLRVEREHCLLEDLDWTVRSGEHWAILGPNGSGKSSILSVLTGYLVRTRGQISLFGQRHGHTDWRVLRRRLGFVSGAIGRRVEPQETALDMVLSGLDASLNYWGHASLEELEKAEARLVQMGLQGRQTRAWCHLSEGERQRAQIARALMAEPRLLILDEPCAGLDPVARARLLVQLETLARASDGPSLILVTHHVEELIPAISHVLLLSAGRVVADGPIVDTLTNENLQTAFGAPVSLEGEPGRYRLTVWQ